MTIIIVLIVAIPIVATITLLCSSFLAVWNQRAAEEDSHRMFLGYIAYRGVTEPGLPKTGVTKTGMTTTGMTEPRVTTRGQTRLGLTLGLVTITLLLLGATTATRLVLAGLLARRSTPDGFRQAIEFAPNAAYFERLADLDPDHASEALRRAVALNPRSSVAWTALGLAAERSRDFSGAAQDLEEAARVDRQYLPAWTLANFYFRRGNRTSFWKWARRAAALAYDDPKPLLTLADRVGLSDRLPPMRVIAQLGDSGKLERAYLDLLIDEDRFDDAQAIARTILARARLDRRREGRSSAEDTARLRAFSTRLIAADRGRDALEIWNGIAASSGVIESPTGIIESPTGIIESPTGLIESPTGVIEPSSGLDQAPSGEGFDWRLPSIDGVSSVWRKPVLDFALDGRQPQTCPLLERAVAIPLVSAGRHWRVRFAYSTGVPGLRWAFDRQDGSALPETSAPLETSPGWREAEWNFTPRPHGRAPVFLGRLALFYRRDTGHTRAGGRLQIRSLRVEVE